MKSFKLLLISLLIFSCFPVFSEVVKYDLEIKETTISPTGKSVRALTVNDSIPAPTLRFKLGDKAQITVHNKLKNEDTSLHWHGILLPYEMDGVPYLTTPSIKPGKSFTFEFELKHTGTYWYHSHTGLQEQQGIYGAIVVEDPKENPKAIRDHVIVLSDWTNENPSKVMNTLMRGDEWYAIKKGNAQSLWSAYQANHLSDYLSNQWSRMPPMDLSDIAFDQFWMNGQSQIDLAADNDETVRLRVINAAAASYFYLTAGAPMTIVAADGPEVEPINTERLLIAMGETYDILITIPKGKSVEFVATAQDGSGQSTAIIGKGEILKSLHIPPKANLYNMESILLQALEEKEQLNSSRPPAPYLLLKAVTPSAIDKNAPRRKINLSLTGDMKRYIWSMNGKTLAEDSMIKVKKGEILQIELINNTMMHHPIHLHGHFFRVLNQFGEFSPLKHTVDVPPMGKRTIEFEADNIGDWFIHCHLLYHMDAGMARVISYEEMGENHQPKIDPAMLNPWYFMGEGMFLSNMSMGHLGIMQNREDYYLNWHIGYNDHQEYQYSLGWSHYYNPKWSSFIEFEYDKKEMHHEEEHWETDKRVFVGGKYKLPLFAELSLAVDQNGDLRSGIHYDLHLTDLLTLHSEIEYDTKDDWEWKFALDYRLTKELSITAIYHSEHKFGLGLSVIF